MTVSHCNRHGATVPFRGGVPPRENTVIIHAYVDLNIDIARRDIARGCRPGRRKGILSTQVVLLTFMGSSTGGLGGNRC
jgi:hypothetical protein